MPWENVKPIFRPEGVHMGVMKADPDKCIQCGLCLDNCPLKAWEEDDAGVPKMKAEYACFSCYNCMAACQEDAISIVETYHVDRGFWATDSHPLPAKMPLAPLDELGMPDEYNTIETAVFERRSVRNFEDKPVPESYIRRVLEAGRFAPSAGNCQPWKFIVVTDKALIKEMDEGIMGTINMVYNMYNNDDQVKSLAPFVEPPGPGPGMFDPRLAVGGMGAIAKKYGPPTLNAPCIIMILADERAIGGMQTNVGICGQNMNLVANSLGIKACWVGFVAVIENLPALKDKLGIKPPWHIISSLVLGYPRFAQEGVVPREYRPVTWFREGSDGPEVEK